MNIDKLRRDEHGRLLAKGIHDAVVFEMHFKNSRKEIEIKTISPDKEISIIDIQGVELMNLYNIWGSEIIGSIYFWRLRDVPLDPSLIQRDAMRKLFGDRLGEECEEFFNRLCKKHPEFLLMYLESSYGGDISIVCRNFNLIRL